MTSASLATQLDRDGFAVMTGFVDGGWIARLRAVAEALVDAFEPGAVRSIFTTREQARSSDRDFLSSGDKVRFFFEEDAFTENGALRQDKRLSINKIGHALHRRDTVFTAFSEAHRVEPLARALGQAAPHLLQSMYIFKQPHIGGEVGLHQDSAFLYTEPLSVLGFWIALEDAHQDNGCLWALPGGHRGPLRQRFVRQGEEATRFITLDEAPYDLAALVPLEVKAGTLVVLHGLLPHRSGPNRSPRSRHAYTLHCVDAACRYPADNWLQPGPPAAPSR